MDEEDSVALKVSTIGLIILGLIIAFGMWGCPHYNVWNNTLRGQAELAKAENSKQIAVQEARAFSESAAYRKEAEITRAAGVAEANKIIAEGLGGPEGYLRYLFIEALQNTSCEVIYIPTEAGLPILESTRIIKQ